MGMVSWLRSLTSGAGRAESIYKRGVAKAHEHDFEGAIHDYTEVIVGVETPAELKVMSRLNRGVAYAARRKYAEAREDLQSLLKEKKVPPEVVAAARAKLSRIDKLERLERESTGRTASYL